MSSTTKKKKTQPKPMSISRLSGSRDAKVAALVILEVLAGQRRPSEAHEELGISLTRYYAVEARALQGVIDAMDKRKQGRQTRPETKIAELTRENERLTRELNRAQALVRVAQRTVGLKDLGRKRAKVKKATGKRQRKPPVRVRRAIKTLRKQLEPEATQAPATAN